MTLRNGKQYLKEPAEESPPSTTNPDLSPHVGSIIELLTKITDYYDVQNYENKKNITRKEFINQKIRDYRELFYLTEYYFESLKPPTFIYFWTCLKKTADTLIIQLNAILNNETPNVVLTGNDKTNAIGLLNDLKKVLLMLDNENKNNS